MKRQIFSLILSAAIFTTSPLFAMEKDPELQKSSGIPHRCSTCTQMVKFNVTDIEKGTGKGVFSALLDENVVSVISELPRDDVYSVSFTSKAMYNLCQHTFVWCSLANKEKENFIFPSIRCIKNCFQTASLNYFNLFKDETPEVQVPISWLLSRKDTGISYGQFSSPQDLCSSAYHIFYLSCFDIGKQSFVLFSPREKDLSILESVDGKDLITFSWKSAEGGNLCPYEMNMFRSQGSARTKDTNTDIENCFCIQRAGIFFKK